MAALTAKLVGGGYERPDADKSLPLDVHYAKLAEWLVDRKQVPTDWSLKLQAIQAKAAEAARELPPGFLGQFEGGGGDAAADYFLAQQVLAKLSETAEKGLLGGLKGAAGAWGKVVKAYEYNLIYVAEAAQTLCRNADYEVPFFKKQAAKYQQQLADLEKKKADALKSASAAAADFKQECQQLGVNSSDIRGGLLALTAKLPALAGGAEEGLQAPGITQALAYYGAVVAAQQGGDAAEAEAGLLPTLREVRQGRTEPPATTARDAAAGSEAGGGGGGLQVDWDLGAALAEVGGDDDASTDAAPAAAAISWDLDAADLAVGAGDTAGPSDAASEAAAPLEMSWDIDISGEGEDTSAAVEAPAAGAADAPAATTAVVAVDGEPATVARLVEDAGYRAALLDDLFELRAFLMQRVRELGGSSNELLVSAASEAVRQVGADEAAGMLEAANASLAAFSGDRLKQLISLRTSARYLDRMAAGLQQKAGQEAKFKRAAAEADQRRDEIQRQLMADSAKLAVLLKRTRQAKEAIEAALGSKLGRRVNIQGEVNQLL